VICCFCNREILPGDQKYVSKQAGMAGTYHWSCFIDACKKTKRQSDDYSDTPFLGGDVDISYLGSETSPSN
jgi:hypothetical protein